MQRRRSVLFEKSNILFKDFDGKSRSRGAIAYRIGVRMNRAIYLELDLQPSAQSYLNQIAAPKVCVH